MGCAKSYALNPGYPTPDMLVYNNFNNINSNHYNTADKGEFGVKICDADDNVLNKHALYMALKSLKAGENTAFIIGKDIIVVYAIGKFIKDKLIRKNYKDF